MYEYIKWEYEDKLDIDIIKPIFNASRIIDGVRMYPYIEVDSNRYYLAT